MPFLLYLEQLFEIVPREIVEIASETSYRNPRVYRFIKEYGKQLQYLKGRAKDILSQVFESDKQEQNKFDI